MAKRMFFMLAVVVVVVAGLGFVKYRQIQTAIAQGSSFAPPPDAVTTVVAKSETWPSALNIIGTTAAIQGVTVSADLPERSIRFISNLVRRFMQVTFLWNSMQAKTRATGGGRIGPRSGTHQLRPRSTAGKRRRSRTEPVRQFIRPAKVHRGQGGRNQRKATIDRKTIKAPFSGILGIRQINLGQYLAAGQAMDFASGLESDLREFRGAATGVFACAGRSHPAPYQRRCARRRVCGSGDRHRFGRE